MKLKALKIKYVYDYVVYEKRDEVYDIIVNSYQIIKDTLDILYDRQKKKEIKRAAKIENDLMAYGISVSSPDLDTEFKIDLLNEMLEFQKKANEAIKKYNRDDERIKTWWDRESLPKEDRDAIGLFIRSTKDSYLIGRNFANINIPNVMIDSSLHLECEV